MAASSFSVLETELVFELTPGWVEGWVRVDWVRTRAGVRLLEQGHTHRYDLEPTAFVLAGFERALKRITPSQIARGEAQIGSRGLRVLERLLSKPEFEALEIAAVRGQAEGVTR